MAAKITRDVLESHLACEYKCHLKLVGRQGSPSNYESWLVESKARAKRDAIVNLLAHHRESEIVHDTPLVISTLQNGPNVVLDGTFESNLLSLRFDGLIKAEGSSNLGQFHYVPILFHEGQVRTRQRVLLELFGLHMAQRGQAHNDPPGARPEDGQIHNGENRASPEGRFGSDATPQRSLPCL